MAVTDATLMTGFANFLVDTLTANVTDPVSSRSTKAPNSRFVLHKYTGAPLLYPCITVQVINVPSGPVLGMQTEAYYYSLLAEIEVWVKKSPANADILAQQVLNVIRTTHYGSSSATDNFIYEPQVLSVVPVVMEEDFKGGGIEVIHRRVITVRYRYATRGV